MKRTRIVLLLVFGMLAALLPAGVVGADPGTAVFINEIHYDNTGTDTGEAIEIAGPAGTDLSGWSVVLYNGNGGATYNTANLSGTIPDDGSGFGFVVVAYATNGIQNGSPDGIALVNGSGVVQFLSYEGAFTAVGGPAGGILSTDIGVSEPFDTSVGFSLQLSGTGAEYEDFAWGGPVSNTFGAVNTSQTFTTGPVNASVVVNCGADIVTDAGTPAAASVSASDEDGTVTGMGISVTPPAAGITLTNFVAAGGVGGTATADLNIDGTVAIGSYEVTVTATNDDLTPQTGSCVLDVTAREPATAVSIFDIQFTTDPSGDSPYKDQRVRTEGVVTAFFFDGGNRYTFIQDGTGAWSGLLLFMPDGFVNVGDRLEATGDVSEFFGLTEIALAEVVVLSSANALPAPEVLSSVDVPQEMWESVLVRVEDVVVEDEGLGFGEWLVNDGTGGARVDDLAFYDYEPSDGDSLAHVQGPLFYSFGNFKIEPRDDGDILQRLTIPEIQGAGESSDFVGQTVETMGVVTAITANGRDAWIQDPDGDGDSVTSDGIFVDDFNTLSPEPSVGDLIKITGEVEEVQFGNALPLTRIDDTELVEIAMNGYGVPAPVILYDLPDQSIAEGIAFWEALEGMLVSVTDATVVAPTSRFGEFGMLTEMDAIEGSGYYESMKQILLRSIGFEMVDYNPERILVDDATLDDAIQVKPGDQVRGLTGVVDYTFGAYKLQPTWFDVKAHKLPNGTVAKRSGPKGDTVITSFNVENLFDTVDNPLKDDGSSNLTQAELEVKLKKLAMAIEYELELPSILVVQEVENTEVLQQLGDLVNVYAGTDYAATSFETSDGRGIEVGFLWDADRVDLLEAFQLFGPDVEAAFGPSSASPGREPLYGKFQVGDEVIHIVGNHFKSKGGDDPIYGVSFVRITEVQRKLQAQVVRDFVDVLLTDDPVAKVMITGDLNDFPFAEPGEGADHPVGILEGVGGGAPLTNLINLEKPAERWTFVFDGNSQVLDHMLVNDALMASLAGFDVLHFNAGYPDALGEDDSTALRASDHDAVEGRFNLGGLKLDVDKPSLSLDLSKQRGSVRFATFNASLNRFNAGDLITDLSTPDDEQAQTVSEIIQHARPDVLLINEFDYDAGGLAAEYFQDNYLGVSQNGATPIEYPYRLVAPANTGVPSGFDLDNSGSIGGPNDAFGFGFFPGQYGMAVYSMYPIDYDAVRTFQNFIWKDMPGALLPENPPGTPWYSAAELDVVRLSSKSHWDVPIELGKNEVVHFLVSHPTPPVFDGPEDRNGTRNHDEIRFWADYVDPAKSGYIYDDDGGLGGLSAGTRFVIAGDQNSDPLDGDSIPGSAQLLTEHPLINNSIAPMSAGAAEQAALQGRINLAHQSDPAFDTADFSDSAPGNLRADYVLADVGETVGASGVFWPVSTDPLFSLVGTFPFPSSDHRLVWIDVKVK